MDPNASYNFKSTRGKDKRKTKEHLAQGSESDNKTVKST